MIRMNYDKLVAGLLAVSPLLDPYILIEIGSSSIKIMDLLIIFSSILYLYNNKGKFRTNNIMFISIIFIFLILTMISFIVPYKDRNLLMSLKSFFVWLIYSILVLIIWNCECRQYFIKYASIICLFSIIIVFLQFIFGNLHLEFWNGQIPIFKLSKYDDWAGYIDPNTFQIRPCGIFQEASYVGLYCMPVLLNNILKGNLKYSLLISTGMILTSSIICVGGVFICWAIFIIQKLKGIKKVSPYKMVKAILVVLSILCILIYLYNNNTYIKMQFDYLINRLNSFDSDLSGVRMSSSKLRIIGNANDFFQYPLYFQLFGVGIAQYGVVLGLEITYSNVFVTTLLNYGYIGIIFFIFWIIYLMKYICKINRIYLVPIVFVFFGDNIWFNWYFFYMFSWSFLLERKEKSSDE